MGCEHFFYDKLDNLGYLLKLYEQTLDLMARGKVSNEQRIQYEINNKERKEEIRLLLSDLNDVYDKNPKEKKSLDRYQKLNEKFQQLLLEESNISQYVENDEGGNSSKNGDKRYIRFLPI